MIGVIPTQFSPNKWTFQLFDTNWHNSIKKHVRNSWVSPNFHKVKNIPFQWVSVTHLCCWLASTLHERTQRDIQETQATFNERTLRRLCMIPVQTSLYNWKKHDKIWTKSTYTHKVGPERIVIHGVMGPLEMAENKWETGVTTYNPYKCSYNLTYKRAHLAELGGHVFSCFLMGGFKGAPDDVEWFVCLYNSSWKLQGCYEEICLVQSCPKYPKLGTIKMHWKFIAVKRKKQTGNWGNAARVTLRFLIPKKINIQPFSISFSRLLPTFIPTKCYYLLHVELRMPLLLGIHHLLQPRHHFFIRTMSPGRAPEVRSHGCVLVLLCELLNQRKRHIYLVSIYYSSIHQSVYSYMQYIHS